MGAGPHPYPKATGEKSQHEQGCTRGPNDQATKRVVIVLIERKCSEIHPLRQVRNILALRHDERIGLGKQQRHPAKGSDFDRCFLAIHPQSNERHEQDQPIAAPGDNSADKSDGGNS